MASIGNPAHRDDNLNRFFAYFNHKHLLRTFFYVGNGFIVFLNRLKCRLDHHKKIIGQDIMGVDDLVTFYRISESSIMHLVGLVCKLVVILITKYLEKNLKNGFCMQCLL